PVPAHIIISGVLATSSGRWNAECEGRTASWMWSPGSRGEGELDATPRGRCAASSVAEKEGASRTPYVTGHGSRVDRGDEEMEYCRTRMGVSMAKKSPKGKSRFGYRSSRDSALTRLDAISEENNSGSLVNFSSSDLVSLSEAAASSMLTSRFVAGTDSSTYE